MNTNDFGKSKFLKKEDVGRGMLVTISRITEENVAQDGAEPEMKYCVWFSELDKPLVCNKTNAQLIAMATGHSEEVEHTWPGCKVVLFNDPSVAFGGKVMGGIRVRAPKLGTVAPAPAAPIDNDLPF